MKTMKTIAVIEVKGRVYYFNIMENYSFQVSLDETKLFNLTSFKGAWGNFQEISEKHGCAILLID